MTCFTWAPLSTRIDYNILYSDQGGDLAPFRAFAERGRLRNQRFPALSLMTHPYAGKPLSTQRSLLDCT